MTGYYSAIKKNEILPFATAWMDPQGIMLSEIKVGIPYDFTYMWNPKSTINEQTKLKQTYRHREHTDGCQREGGQGDWVKKGERRKDKKYKLVVTKQSQGRKVQRRKYSK